MMAEPLKPVPSSFGARYLNALLLPAKHYTYFKDADRHPYQGNASNHSAINAWWLADCSLLAYDEKDNIAATLGQVPSATPEKPVFKAESFHWFENSQTGLDGFGIQSEDESFAILSFRGTEFYRTEEVWLNLRKQVSSGIDLLQDTQLWTETFIGPPQFDVPIVKGFYQPLQSVWPQLQTWISALPPTQKLWLTGHSMGAVIAVLLAYQIPNRVAGVYTYGCPCPGHDEFTKAYRQRGLFDKTFRYVHGNDLVVKGLAFINSPYRHVGKEMLLSSESRRNAFERIWNNLFHRDITDHAPLYYSLLCWNAIPD